MIRGWIRVWRKIEDSDIIRDAVALQIFIYLMVIVDRKTGEKKIGRFWMSKVLGLKPGTFYDGLKRLEKKYKIATLESNNKFTTIRLVNWNKYQSSGFMPTQYDNNKPTTNQQQTNTLQEYKNGELRKGAVLKKPYNPLEEFERKLKEDLYKEAEAKKTRKTALLTTS
jgi:hypothetical protein